MGIIFSFVYAFFGYECIELMTSDPVVLNAFWPYRYWLVAMPIVSALAFMWDGIYVGATAGVQIRNAMIWAAVAFVVFYAATYRFIGIQALYAAYFAHLFARVIYLTVKWRKTESGAIKDL
jgi:MATE family multidrug resistance protein